MRLRRRAAAAMTAAAVVAGGVLAGIAFASPAQADVAALEQPIRARTLPDGRVLVIEKAGVVKLAANATAPAVPILDIRDQVASYEDHGLTTLGYRDGYMYLGYTAQQAGTGDECANFTIESGGCPTTAYLSRFSLSGTGVVGREERLFGGIPQICILYTTHGLDDFEFGPDGRMYFSVGDGAGFTGIDVGQGPNADFCGTDEGNQKGALRSQTDHNLNGKIVSALPDGSDMRIEAKGLRNPFSISFDDGGDLWIGDTGWSSYEEINRMTPGGPQENFGWPCYEGPAQNQPPDLLSYTEQPVCQQLIAAGTVVPPVQSYEHPETAGATGKFASISALSPFNGRIYFGDYSQTTVASMLPDGSDLQIHASSRFPVDLVPVGDTLWMVDIGTGSFAPAPIAGTVDPPEGEPVAQIFSSGEVTPGSWLKLTVTSNLIPERQTDYGILWTARFCDGPTGQCRGQYFTNRSTQQTETEVPADLGPGDRIVIDVQVERAGVRATDTLELSAGGGTTPPPAGGGMPPSATAGMVSGLIESFSAADRTIVVAGTRYAYDENDFFKIADKGEWIVTWEQALCVGCTLNGSYVPGGVSEFDLVPGDGAGTTPPPPAPGGVTGTVQAFDLTARTVTVGGRTFAYDDSEFFKLDGGGEWIVKWEQRLAVGASISGDPYAPGGMSEWDLATR